MQLTLIAAVGVISIVAVAAFSARIGVATPLLLVVVGIALSFLPGLPAIEPNPEWILAGVLPPLLYSTAVRTPATDFRRDLKAIIQLAVLLVVVTTVASGYLFHTLVPGIGLATAFALGAVISPTDAVAATAVGKRLGLPSRLLTILEGEGLVNDATALVLLSSAVAAITGSTHLTHIGLKFVYSVALALAVGWILGEINVRVRGLLHDPVLDTAISFTVPFLAYIPAQELHASGVLAVVACGLVTGNRSVRFLDAQDRLAEAINWATIAFLLENAIFLVLGLQLKTLLDQESAAGLDAGTAIGIGLLAAVLVVVIRMLFVAPLVSSLRHDADRAESMIPTLEAMRDRIRKLELGGRLSGRRRAFLQHRVTRKRADVDFAVTQKFGWRGGVILAWGGMRGAVTVAAVQTLPTGLRDRPQLLLIAFVVACASLLVQGLTLPAVIRAVNVPGDDPAADRTEYGRLLGDLSSAAELVLDDDKLVQPDGTPYPVFVIDRVREDLRIRMRPPAGMEHLPVDPREQYQELRLRALQAERAQLLKHRAAGDYNTRVLGRAQRNLDIEETRLQRISDFANDTNDEVQSSAE
jgi:monovalent cation/hydrogen antiporter